MMKRASDTAPAANGSGIISPPMEQDISGDAKKAKFEDHSDSKPSRVLHIRGLPQDVTEGEVVQLGLPFGHMSNLVVARKKNQALLEMSDLSSSMAMINYYCERPAQIRNRNVYLQYSNHQQLKTESSSQNTQAQAALQAADQLLENREDPKTVLRIIIDNMMYPITIEILKTIFSKYGVVQKIVTFNKNNTFQALLQYADAITAQTAKMTLNGQNIYNGCCTLRIDFSKLQSINVKYNNDKSWDFTNPNLPTGDNNQQQQQQQQPPMRNYDNGILGGFAGPENSFANMGGMQAMQNIQGGFNMGFGMGGMTGGGMGGFGSMGNQMRMPGMGGQQGSCPVLLVSNLNEEKVTTDALFTLFGVYGNVTRVKIMFNKKDSALVQFMDPVHAGNAQQQLDRLKLWGKNLKVSVSKHGMVQMPREGQSDNNLTKDYSNSSLHRYKNVNSKNYNNIFPPSAVLHLSSIPEATTEDQLRALFSKYSNVLAFRFFHNDRRMALIQLESIEDAAEALIELHNYELPGGHLKVSFTKSTIS